MKVPQKVREAVLSRERSRCLRCDVLVLNIPSEVHHRKPRQMGGTRDVRSYDLRNLVLLCSECHREVESDRSLAYETGWLLRGYHLDVPVISKDGRRIYLQEDGSPSEEVIDAASILAAEAMA